MRSYVIYVFVLFSIVIATAYFIGLMHNLFIKNTGKLGFGLQYVTAIVGTPIHELGHLTMNIIFRHKVDSFKLLQLNAPDGQFGYVKYSYNPKSIYQQIGNFFTALGPIIFGGLVLYTLIYVFANEQYDMVIIESKKLISSQNELSLSSVISLMADYVIIILDVFFSIDFVLSPNFIILTILSFSVAFHMSLSTADIKNGIKGGLIFLLFVLVIGILMNFISADFLNSVSGLLVTVIYNVLIFFLFSLVLNLIITIFGIIYKAVVKVLT